MMMMADATERRVLCVDDNPHVTSALRAMFRRAQNYRWIGSLPDATDLVSRAEAECPDLVILDLDMPGPDPFDVLPELIRVCPEVRTVVFTGHVRRDYIDRAIEAGAWGYVSKNDSEDQLFEALEHVLAGRFAFSPEVRSALGH